MNLKTTSNFTQFKTLSHNDHDNSNVFKDIGGGPGRSTFSVILYESKTAVSAGHTFTGAYKLAQKHIHRNM